MVISANEKIGTRRKETMLNIGVGSIYFLELMEFFKFLLIILLFGVSTYTVANDVILLNDGSELEGTIVKLGNNSFSILVEGDVVRVNNYDVLVVGFEHELEEQNHKYRLGFLDGKRYAKNKAGNFIVGFSFILVGTIIVYVASSQYPSDRARSLSANKILFDDPIYLQGYQRGAKATSGRLAIVGTLAWVIFAINVLS